MEENFTSTVIYNEWRVFRCILQNPKLLYEVQEGWFSCPESAKLFKTLKSLYEKGVSLTTENVATESGISDYLDAPENFFNVEFDLSEWSQYVRLMRLEFVKQDINKKVLDELKMVTSRTGDLDLDKVQELHKLLTKDIDLVRGDSKSLQTITQIGERYRGALISRKLGEDYPFGDYMIDRIIPTGAAPGQMTTVFGSTGMGKSAFALNLFSKQINKRIPCMYITLEMDEITTMDRLVSLRQRVPMKYFLMRERNYSIDDSFNPDFLIEIAEKELKDLKKYEDRFFLVDQPSLTLRDLEGLISDAKKRMGVDYLVCTVDLWTMLHGVGSKATDIEEAVNLTNEIVKRQNVHLINIVQANRAADSKTVGTIENIDSLKPRSVNAIKNSGAIAERSRQVLSVFRRKHYAQELFPNDPQLEFMDDVFEVTLLKSSNSQVGRSVKYLYDGACFRLDPFLETQEDAENIGIVGE